MKKHARVILPLFLAAAAAAAAAPVPPLTTASASDVSGKAFDLIVVGGTDETANRRLPDKPTGYNRAEYVRYTRKDMTAGQLRQKRLEPARLAAAICAAEAQDPPPLKKTRGDVLLQLWTSFSQP